MKVPHAWDRALDRHFSIGIKQSRAMTTLIAAIPETDWVTIADLPGRSGVTRTGSHPLA